MPVDIPPRPEPTRRGIPADPVLQLYAGELRRLPDVVVSGAGWSQICVANPARVCLYVQSRDGSTEWRLAVDPLAPLTLALSTGSQLPLDIHCRDYPGMTQSQWFALGGIATTLSVWEYTLQPWW